MKKIVILISGRGSNMEALITARAAGALPVTIAAVISNRPDAAGLATATAAPNASMASRLTWLCSQASCASWAMVLCAITRAA